MALPESSPLAALFRPKSVAIVGASADPRKPGHIAVRNLLELGYRGAIFPVNPRESTVLGLPCYRNISEIGEPVELCIMLLSADLSVQLARDLAERRKRSGDVLAAICMSAGFAELNTGEARERERELTGTLKTAGIRLVGPNCLGVIDTESGLNTNFDIASYPRGGISLITQSGAFGNSFLLSSRSACSAGLAKYVSVGNMADVSVAELLMFLADDDATRVIAVYLEGLADPREFFTIAGDVARKKPVVVFKSGRSDAGSTAALSHTGAVAGRDALYDGAFRQSGLIRARTVPEFYDTLRAFEKQPFPCGNRVCVLTHMGGPGTICVDEIASLPDLRLAEFSDSTRRALREVLSPAANVGSPNGYIDMTAAHTEALHNRVLGILFADDNIDLVIQVLGPSGFLDQKLLAREIADACRSQAGAGKPLLNVVTFGQFAQELRQGLENEALPVIAYPDLAANVAANLVRYAGIRRAAAKEQKPASDSRAVDRSADAAGRLITSVRRQGRATLLEPEAYDLCGQYGIRVPPFSVASGPDEACGAAREMGYPVVLKAVAPEILHKTEAGGVILGIGSDTELAESYGKLVERVKKAVPGMQRAKVLVQKMMPPTMELAAGAIRDKSFGPVVMFGLGGIYIEALRRVAFRLAPLDMDEARALILETLPRTVIGGAGGRLKINVDSIARVLVALGRLLDERPEIDELDLNPLLPCGDECIAVDARVVLSGAAVPARRFASR